MNIWFKILGYTGAIICYFTIIFTLIFSAFNNYQIIITTNTMGEFWPETIILSLLFICLIFMFFKEDWGKKKQ